MLDIGAKKRLIGAVVLVILAAVFLPMLVEDEQGLKPVPDAEFASPPPPPVDRGRQAEVFPNLDEAAPRAMGTGTAPGLSEPKPAAAGGGLSADELEAAAPVAPTPPVPEAKPTPPVPAVKPAPPDPPKAAAKPEGSKAAASKPDPVKPEQPKAKPGEAAPSPVPKGRGSWVVQVAALSTPEAAQQLEKKLRAKGYSAFVQKLEGTNRTLWRVRVGPEVDRDRAKAAADEIKRQTGLPDVNVQKYRDG
jgi:DedD protein